MCGIAGLAGPLARDPARLRAMTDVQSHRGPDASGHWHDETHPVALGHRRLAIIDLSPDGVQPMASPATRAPGPALDKTTREALDRVMKYTEQFNRS